MASYLLIALNKIQFSVFMEKKNLQSFITFFIIRNTIVIIYYIECNNLNKTFQYKIVTFGFTYINNYNLIIFYMIIFHIICIHSKAYIFTFFTLRHIGYYFNLFKIDLNAVAFIVNLSMMTFY